MQVSLNGNVVFTVGLHQLPNLPQETVTPPRM
jgi:hypothetical protein